MEKKLSKEAIQHFLKDHNENDIEDYEEFKQEILKWNEIEALKIKTEEEFYGKFNKHNRKSNRSRYVQRIGNKFIHHKK